jgi:capsular polysaccharide biosynthesis protein
METPRYLQILWSYKWLLVVGVIVAAAAGMLAGFTIVDGKIVSRAEGTYVAATTVMLQGQDSTLLQSEIPGQTISASAPQTTTPPQPQNLSQSASVYAYLASSDAVRDRVEKVVGKFSDTDGMTAVARTTPPSGTETFPGRLQLPMIDIAGTAATPARATEIAKAATKQFREYIVAKQEAAKVPANIRVDLVTLQQKAPIQAAGSNPAIPIVVAACGVFLAFIALIFILNGARTSRRQKRRAASANTSASVPATD